MAKSAGAKSKSESALFLPGPEYWEVWKSNGDGLLHREEVTDMNAVAPERIPGGVHYAFPVVTSFAVPFWASTDDPAILDDVGDMQLERLGLKPANLHGKMREYRVIDNIGKRSLAVATVLAPVSKTEFPKQAPTGFQVSPYHYPLPLDSVAVWKELGKLVMVVTRNDSPVYFQALSSNEIDATAVQEIKCVLLQLLTQEVIEGVEQVVLWLGSQPDEAVARLIEGELGVTARFRDPPDPELSGAHGQLLPEEVAVLRENQERRRRLRNWIFLGIMVYVILLGLFVGRLWMTHRKADEVRRQLADDTPGADAARQTQMRWEVFKPAINPDVYPIELFSKVVELLPVRGVRLTEFEARGEGIFLKGEASSVSDALRFKGDLINKPLLSDYEWNFPQPTILTAGGATFFANGKPKYGSP